ncbi:MULTISPECIES: 1-deoxy-D-xylulose-5-phosphate reductoisomerase [unclassified Micromonospora]|uniref:1-deoxy-D-xylulose-5-phosphate reductoisomerase n=1 Tax=unclassified Micromonospora TaxID=2617518 RepID=UPI00363600EC
MLSTGGAARHIVLLGSTGSVGTQAVDVLQRYRDRFIVHGLAASGRRLPLLAQQVLDLEPEIVAVADPDAEQPLKAAVRAEAERRGIAPAGHPHPTIVTGSEGVERLAASNVDVVLNAIDGALGLGSTLAAINEGNIVALANKESLIVGSDLIKQVARPGQLVPVDSEHAAIAQCLRASARSEVRRLVLTATGGPFRGWPRAKLSSVTPAQAQAHPTWSMGPVISINSATLMNKGLEVIEAHLLFDVSLDDIVVMLHPTSEIHSMVEFCDGAVIAQASPPDMRLAIAFGLAFPDRLPDVARKFDWTRPYEWRLDPLDNVAFPAVELARHVGRTGGGAPAVYNAANEICVQRFLAKQLSFVDIIDTVAQVVDEYHPSVIRDMADISAVDAWARTRAVEVADATGLRSK